MTDVEGSGDAPDAQQSLGSCAGSSSWSMKELIALTGPPHSPDLNPTQHLWDVMFRSIELRDALVQIWEEVPHNTRLLDMHAHTHGGGGA